MATETEIKQVLDLLTIAEQPRIESLGRMATSRVVSLRRTAATDNIVAMGISEKTTRNESTGELALTFYVEKKLPLSALSNTMRLPALLPESIAGNTSMPTDVVEIGKIRLEANAAGTLNITRDPIQPGFSIGHTSVTAGTLGALVKKGRSTFFLSNSHVFANSGLGKIGDPILYPAVMDGGLNPQDLVANLHQFEAFTEGGAYTNHVDCALAKPTRKSLLNAVAAIKDIGLPKGTGIAERGMKVVKVGRTTGKTIGEVKDVHFRTIINYPDVGRVGFLDQVFCTRYTAGGDSGSLVLDDESKQAVGLHFAGADGGSIFNPIHKVLETLGVQLVTG